MRITPKRRRERGSVLLVCLGLLVVMALMATAFISSVTLHRDSAKNVRRRSMAEMAALSGKAHVIAAIDDHMTELNTSAFSGGGNKWFSPFHDTAGTVTDMWRHAGVDDITNTANFGAYVTISGNAGKSKWIYITRYDRDLKRSAPPPWQPETFYHLGQIVGPPDPSTYTTYADHINNELNADGTFKKISGLDQVVWECTQEGLSGDTPATANSDFAGNDDYTNPDTFTDGSVQWTCRLRADLYPIQLRYAASVMDLSGLVKANKTAAVAAPMAMIMDTGSIGVTCEGTPFNTTVYTSADDAFSWEQIRGRVNAGSVNDIADRALLLTSPYQGEEPAPGTLDLYVNINTAPLKVIETLYQNTAGTFGGTAGNWGGIAGQFAVGVRNHSADKTAIPGYSTGDRVMKAMVDTTHADYGSTSAFFYVGKSKFFRAIVRGQLYDTVKTRVIGEANLEFVYYNDDSGNKYVLFQRWVSKD